MPKLDSNMLLYIFSISYSSVLLESNLGYDQDVLDITPSTMEISSTAHVLYSLRLFKPKTKE